MPYSLSTLLLLGLCLTTACRSETARKENGPLRSLWQRDPNNPIVAGAGPTVRQMADPCVIHEKERTRLWFSCVGDDPGCAHVGHAEQAGHGTAWSRPHIVFSPAPAGSWDDQTSEIPTVILDPHEPDENRRYRMWYGGSNAEAPNLTRLGLAFSRDGLHWERLPAGESPYGQAGLVLVPEDRWPGNCAVVSDPTVVRRPDGLHLWYSSWGEDELVITYAFSTDGIHWEHPRQEPVLRAAADSWESGGLGLVGTVAQPAVLWDPRVELFRMWYGVFDTSNHQTYSGLGHAWSRDGQTWEKTPLPVFRSRSTFPGEENGLSTGACVTLHQGRLHLWYASVDSHWMRVINHAELKD
jgi:predicted GH43/DUF377 family glycosyl hydrolase